MIRKLEYEVVFAYATSKTGLNTAVAKFSAQYAKQGVLFLIGSGDWLLCRWYVDLSNRDDRG